MTNLFRNELRTLRRSLAAWCLVCGLLLIVFLWFFPSMKNMGLTEMLEDKMGLMPQGLLAAFGLDTLPDFSKLDAFFGYVFQYIVIAGAAYAGVLGANSLIREETDGTIEFLYARPVSRNKIYLSKLLACLLCFLLFTGILWGVTATMGSLVMPEGQSFHHILAPISETFFGLLLIGLFFLSCGMLLSTLVQSSKQAAPLALAVVFVTYLMGVFAAVVPDLSFLAHLSPIHYFQPSEVLQSGLNLPNICVVLACATLFLSLGWMVYRKKDFRLQ